MEHQGLWRKLLPLHTRIVTVKFTSKIVLKIIYSMCIYNLRCCKERSQDQNVLNQDSRHNFNTFVYLSKNDSHTFTNDANT